jgi:AbiV family abortive infection protein
VIPREVYKEAMDESLKNAKALVQEAYLVAKHVSNTHALMLKNLAIEEVAKAYVCWQVANGILPLNHPYADPCDNRGVFKSHNTKNTIYMTLANTKLLFGMKKSNDETPILSEQELLVLSLFATTFGKEGTKRRFEWMYVNIIKVDDDHYSVSSPLSKDKDLNVIDFRGIKSIIGMIESFDEFSKTQPFLDNLEMLRAETRKFDTVYPDNPLWD